MVSSPYSNTRSSLRLTSRHTNVAPMPLTPPSTKKRTNHTTAANVNVNRNLLSDYPPRSNCLPATSKHATISKKLSLKNNNSSPKTTPPIVPSASAVSAVAISAKATVTATATMIVPTEVDFQSILRIRPLTKHELNDKKNDPTALTLPEVQDDDGKTVHLHKGEQPVGKYHFDEILASDASQKDTYERVGGLAMAWDAMNPLLLRSDDDGCADGETALNIQKKNHVIISIGVSNSGKTYSTFGQNANCNSNSNSNGTEYCNRTSLSSKNTLQRTACTSNTNTPPLLKNAGDGIVPRIIDDLFFAQEDKNMRRMLMQTPPRKQRTTGDDHDIDTKVGKEVTFGVQITMVHVHNDRVLDMLSSYPSSNNETTSIGSHESGTKKHTTRSTTKKKSVSNVLQMAASFETKRGNKVSKSSVMMTAEPVASMDTLRITQNPHTQDFCVNPQIITSSNSSHARKVLAFGLEQSIISSTSLNEFSSRGHTIITLIPILSKGNNEHDKILGGSITIMDLAGIERTKNSYVSGKALKESVAINKSVFGVLQCLRTIKKQNHTRRVGLKEKDTENQTPNNASLDASPRGRGQSPVNTARKYMNFRVETRQNKLTMLMQPLLSGNIGRSNNNNVSKAKTNVILLVSAYPGSNDYHEKKALLSEIDALHGLSISCMRKQTFVDEKNYTLNTNLGNIHPNSSKNGNLSKKSPLKRLSNVVTSMSDKKRRVKETRTEVLPEKATLSGDGFPRLRKCDAVTTTNQNLGEEYPDSPKKRNHSKTSPLIRIGNVVTSMSGKKRRTKEIETELIEKVTSLEDEIVSLRENNRAGIDRYDALAIENQSLRELLAKAIERGRDDRKEIESARIRQLQDSELYERGLKARRREQNLLKSPLRKHMGEVENKIFQRYNSGQKENQVEGSFGLALPHNNCLSLTPSDRKNSSYLELLSSITRK